MTSRVSRRSFLHTGSAALIGGKLVQVGKTQGRGLPAELSSVKAVVFDTFGTVVDWRSSIAREVEELAKRKRLPVDGEKFADAWRGQYGQSMNRVRNGQLPWTKLDALHRMILDTILPDFGMTALSENEKETLNRAWHRLRPWPDAV